MNWRAGLVLGVAVAAAMVSCGCSSGGPAGNDGGPPEPVVTHTQAQPGQRVEHGEVILDVDAARQQLHAQHHPYKVLETRRVAGIFEKPAMTDIDHFALPKRALDVINPGPGEYVHVMEGQRHGYQNLTDRKSTRLNSSHSQIS